MLSSTAKLKNGMTAGDDFIPDVMVRECVSVLTRPFVINRLHISNYRLVSALPHFSKMLEHSYSLYQNL